jgi:hypothetical protein
VPGFSLSDHPLQSYERRKSAVSTQRHRNAKSAHHIFRSCGASSGPVARSPWRRARVVRHAPKPSDRTASARLERNRACVTPRVFLRHDQGRRGPHRCRAFLSAVRYGSVVCRTRREHQRRVGPRDNCQQGRDRVGAPASRSGYPFGQQAGRVIGPGRESVALTLLLFYFSLLHLRRVRTLSRTPLPIPALTG